mmetsp:Transcript_15334/g.36196  ORF Transcript_15334/g.36196 Transcript_15334/m.36196 type:complete len:467 (-) Transcript_15334:63-1463(-)
MQISITGVLLSVLGNLCITGGLNIQKYVHNQISVVEKSQQVSYVRIPSWWLGILMMATGEGGNFMAYGYASATVVAPLGSVSVVANAFVSHLWLKEPMTRRGIIGMGLAIVGSVIIVLYAPHQQEEITMSQYTFYLQQWPFIFYLALVAVSMVALLLLPVKYKETYVVLYILMCSLLGSITVLCTQGISTAVVLTASGDNQFFHALPWALIVVAAATIFFQMRYLNNAMGCFGASAVVPVYYVLFTFFAIVSGIVLLQETEQEHGYYNAIFVAGCLITFAGVYLITKPPDLVEDYSELDEELGEMKGSSLPPLELQGISSDFELRPRPLSGSMDSAGSGGSPFGQRSSRRLSRRESSDVLVQPGTPLVGIIDIGRRWLNGEEGLILSPGETSSNITTPDKQLNRNSLPTAILPPLTGDPPTLDAPPRSSWGPDNAASRALKQDLDDAASVPRTVLSPISSSSTPDS